MNYSTKIRNLRIQRGLTQMQMATDLSTSQASITSWETGRREPDFKTFRRLAEYFNVPLSALLPSDDEITDDYVRIVSESLATNPILEKLFNTVKDFPDSKLNVLLTVAESMTIKENE